MAKRLLLMIDKNVYDAGIYANRFATAGWNTLVEEGIENAKKRLKRRVPHVIMLDLEPLDESLAFIRAVREDPRMKATLLIARAASGDRDTVRAALDAGVDAYFFKGHISPSEAVKKTKRLFEERSHEKHPYENSQRIYPC